jgi:hypothetical protein
VDGAPAPSGGEPPDRIPGRGQGCRGQPAARQRPLDVTPAAHGQTTTMVLRFINEQGRELDRVVFSRTAGG